MLVKLQNVTFSKIDIFKKTESVIFNLEEEHFNKCDKLGLKGEIKCWKSFPYKGRTLYNIKVKKERVYCDISGLKPGTHCDIYLKLREWDNDLGTGVSASLEDIEILPFERVKHAREDFV